MEACTVQIEKASRLGGRLPLLCETCATSVRFLEIKAFAYSFSTRANWVRPGLGVACASLAAPAPARRGEELICRAGRSASSQACQLRHARGSSVDWTRYACSAGGRLSPNNIDVVQVPLDVRIGGLRSYSFKVC